MGEGGPGVPVGVRSPTDLLHAAAARGLDRGRAALAVRAAVAAAAAWLVVWPLGGLADEYPYYAPFGAVVAVTGTVAVSARASLGAVAAIMVGSAVALGFAAAPLPEAVALAAAVGVGTLLAGWTPLRASASWVPMAAVFVLELGGQEPWEFATAYFALTALGALVGTAVDLAYPALPWRETDDSLRGLRRSLADQLDAVADTLGSDDPPDPDVWVRTRTPVVDRSVTVDATVAEAAVARRANWRARGWWHVPEAQQRRAETLRHLAMLVQDLRTMLEAHEHRDVTTPALGPSLRRPAAEAARAVAAALRSATPASEAGEGDADELDDEQRRDLEVAVAALRALEEEVRRNRRETQADLFAAASAVTTLWRVLATVVPPALREELAPGW